MRHADLPLARPDKIFLKSTLVFVRTNKQKDRINFLQILEVYLQCDSIFHVVYFSNRLYGIDVTVRKFTRQF